MFTKRSETASPENVLPTASLRTTARVTMEVRVGIGSRGRPVRVTHTPRFEQLQAVASNCGDTGSTEVVAQRIDDPAQARRDLGLLLA